MTKASTALQTTASILKNYYRDVLRQKGPSLAGVDWPNEANAHLRYELHLRAARHTNAASILDVGCGLAHLHQVIASHPLPEIRRLAESYQGIDGVAEMIDHAKVAAPGADFICADAMDGLQKARPADLVVANGLFTVKGDASDGDMQQFVDSILDGMWEKATLAVSFNLMSDNVDTRYERLYYVNPGDAVAHFTRKFGRHYVVFGDSHLYDTFYVWLKQPDCWQPV